MGHEITGARNRAAQVKKERPNALTNTKRQLFLDMLAATANVRRAAAAADADATAFYRLRSRDAEFAAAWRQALADALVRLEGEVLARALGERDAPVGNALVGDGERAGAAGEVDVMLALELLKRKDTTEARGTAREAVAQRRRAPIEEVERVLLRRLDALARRWGQA